MEHKVLKLSDGFKYVVTGQAEHEGDIYCQLLRVDDDGDFIIAKKVGDELTIIEDDTLKLTLLQKFAQHLINKLKAE